MSAVRDRTNQGKRWRDAGSISRWRITLGRRIAVAVINHAGWRRRWWAIRLIDHARRRLRGRRRGIGDDGADHHAEETGSDGSAGVVTAMAVTVIPARRWWRRWSMPAAVGTTILGLNRHRRRDDGHGDGKGCELSIQRSASHLPTLLTTHVCRRHRASFGCVRRWSSQQDAAATD